ncbi:MAG: pyruvate kinase [Bdellovibrionaceae bacterium]|nr:pyruvate kinase [Pseudobdellovibrionaceae bacterium]
MLLNFKHTAKRRAKIVATLGPTSSDRSALKKLILAGTNVMRLNFSHGDHNFYKNIIKTIRELSSELKTPVNILQDLQGPKIRIAKLPKSILLKKNQKLVFGFEKDVAAFIKKPSAIFKQHKNISDIIIPVDFKKVASTCKKGSKILIDDGLIELKVLDIKGSLLLCTVIYDGELHSRKGFCIPGALLPLDPLTKKDLKDLKFGLDHNVDSVALSFVRNPKDILKLRKLLVKYKKEHVQVISKIEMLGALDYLDEIIKCSDSVMVARGDLCVELGASRLPAVQKQIISMANKYNKPVITATQMLDSMIHNPRPTRAEITDVANAILDGSDAVMLSGETAQGAYPVKCVKTMHDIILEAEKSLPYYQHLLSSTNTIASVGEAIAASVCLSAKYLNAKVIICLTTTGQTATHISSFRPKVPIIAATHSKNSLNQLALAWGVSSISIKAYKNSADALKQIQKILLKKAIVKKGDLVVLSLGLPVDQAASTNSLKIHRI